MKRRMLAISSFIVRYTRKVNWPGVLFCCSPLLIFVSVFLFLDVNPLRWVPLWNDEAGWYIQINSTVKYGNPVGFTGYNETHAVIGTFGPWGAFSVCIMSLFGRIFGWHYYSPLFMNLVYWMLANFIFYLFTRPKRATVLKLSLLNFTLFLFIQYMFTGMSECTRFSMAIVLAGMIFFLLNESNKEKRSYIVVLSVIAPVLLFIFINSYILFSFLLPFYGYAWFKYLKPGKCRFLSFAILCALMPFAFASVCFFIQAKTTAPYPVNTLRAYLDQPNAAAFFKALKDTVIANYSNADFVFVFNNTKAANGCFSSYLLIYYILLVVTSVRLIVSLVRKTEFHPLHLLIVCTLLVFMVAFWALYSTKSTWTYIRGLNVALVFSLYLVCMLDWSKLHSVLFGLMFIQFLPFWTTIRDDMALRYSYSNVYGGGCEMMEKYATVFSTKLVPSKSDDPWDNTVASYGRSYNIGCAFPAGLSWNYIMDWHSVSKPRYIVTDATREWSFNGYQKTYSDDLICIFEKMKGSVE